MAYPADAYSWKITSDTVALKRMDKSSFVHHGTSIPHEFAFFFDSDGLDINTNKSVSLIVGSQTFATRIQSDSFSRLRLFWKADFSKMIQDRFPNFQKVYDSNRELAGDKPLIRFERIEKDAFVVELIDPESEPEEVAPEKTNWSDQELEASVDMYLFMLGKELANEKYNKAQINRYLRDFDLSNRSQGSIEFRMQNISAVLQELGHPIIRGYLPRGNVGADVSEKIKNIISTRSLPDAEDYVPTPDEQELNQRTKNIRRSGLIGKPKGRTNPGKQQTSSTVYARDPAVRAWILENADDTCELCSQQGPFSDKEGNIFLEVHHVQSLSDSGADSIENAVALCPNCHRRSHHSEDTDAVKNRLQEKAQSH